MHEGDIHDVMHTIHIRRAVAADAAGVAHVRVVGWRTTYRGIVPDAYLDGLDEGEQTNSWRSWLVDGIAEGRHSFVAERAHDGAIVGFAVCGPERAGDAEYRGEVYALYLVPEVQRTGLGRRLVATCVEALADDGRATLLIWVLADNPARGFYAALGGVPVRRKTLDIAGTALDEIGYGWKDVRPLCAAP